MNINNKSYSRRKVFSFLSGLFIALCSKSAIAEFKAGQPFRDRFQTHRQTFRIEPDPEDIPEIEKKSDVHVPSSYDVVEKVKSIFTKGKDGHKVN